jgi:SnoaL-like domain
MSAARALPVAALALVSALGLSSCGSTPPVQAQVADAKGLEELSAKLLQLEQRKTRLADIHAIRKLQRAWGYYLDEGQWDDAADLFAADATIEIGFDGVYRGRDRVREYLHAMGGGRKGLAPGELNEHFQLMPVITMSGDGRTARGTWRDVMLQGKLGVDAHWGEGPSENEYVKEDGVWKIRSLHWFQTLHVPYEGGWAKHPDDNAGRFVGDRLKADAPPSVPYRSWPGAFTPPFHFRGQVPHLVPIAVTANAPVLSERELRQRIALLESEVDRLAARDQIENLQAIYGYYIDKSQWQQAASLFTDDAELTIQGLGTWRGPEGVLRYLQSTGPEGLQSGRLYDNMQLQPIIDVAADGDHARGRWHLFSQLAQHGQFHEWETGVYENEYERQDGVWKIRRLHLYPTMITPYGEGWGKTSLPRSQFDANAKPDAARKGPSSLYTGDFVTPFHYAHPVRTAKQAGTTARPAPTSGSPAGSLADLDRRLGLLEDHAQIENLQRVYGYYLATLLWDDLAALFAEDGTIEIAMRGVYVGRPAVRRNLNLYGQAGLDDGVLHNHMQFQPVISIAPDGQTAQLRSRALSMMGNYGRGGQWMGGVYENTFVKVDGVWKFRTDRVMNTFFAAYETGWKDLVQRPPPGITESNPPDRPPSGVFEMYPKNYLPPYHYANPVTGRK